MKNSYKWDRDSCLEFLATQEMEAIFEVKGYKSSRSIEQNRYYWGVVIDILANELWYTPEDMHKEIKKKFLIWNELFKQLEKQQQELLLTAVTTTTLNTKQFEELMTNIRQWSSIKLSINIPTPNEADYY